jgi:hypothetical protein
MVKAPKKAPNEEPTHKVHPALPAEAYRCLERLAKKNRLGSTPTEIAKYMILRVIDDMDRAKAIPED